MCYNLLEIEKSFQKFDENWDEKVTLKELDKGLKKSGKMLSADELRTTITAMDKNGNTNYLQKLRFLCRDNMNLYHAPSESTT